MRERYSMYEEGFKARIEGGADGGVLKRSVFMASAPSNFVLQVVCT